MNFQQLIENAALDSFGLLDRREVELFEQELARAPLAAKASVASLQQRLVVLDMPPEIAAGDRADLPTGNLPPADLRERVLATVVTEIAAATIAAAGGDSGSLAIGRSRGVNHWWRAGAIGAMAAAIVLGVTTVMLRASFNEVDNSLRSSALMTQVSGYGNSFESMLLDPTTKFMQFAAVDAGIKPPAAVLLYNDHGDAHFVARDLSHESARFTLMATEEDGTERVLAAVSGPRSAIKCPVNGLSGGAVLALVPAGQGMNKAILKSASSGKACLPIADRFAMLRGVMESPSAN